MGLTSAKGIALTVSLFGLLAFLLGVVAENKKPPYGTPIKGKDVVICKFPSDPTIAMGSLSIVALVLAAFIGHVAIFYPYKGKSVPRGALFQSTSLSVFFVIAECWPLMRGPTIWMRMRMRMTRANMARFMLLMLMARRSESVNCRISKLAPFRYNLDSLCVFEKVGLVLQKIVDMSCHSHSRT
ncbi:uncharacterized protein LOC119319706 isoform X2 [Triticum dicoccoides]|uniref:uncharacterized protein LOC119319706 isoform X2 n=1 Tax=Triticum dicoccoides TaxID=85692 RepID=UPI001890840B|nr:uncharacterized protein LOC119319706 isoform X2 [Triticum dicoccoides]